MQKDALDSYNAHSLHFYILLLIRLLPLSHEKQKMAVKSLLQELEVCSHATSKEAYWGFHMQELKFETEDTKQVFVGIIDSAKCFLAARDSLAQHKDLTN